MKDYFSDNSKDYQKYRPTYPDELVTFITKNLKSYDKAWDCGTGNGQLAHKLSGSFKHVYATDISSNQLQNARLIPNVTYKNEPAEASSFKNNYFDLITVAQAIHWFNFEFFYKEVKRTLKKDGLFCVVGYSLINIDFETNKVIKHFYKNIVGPYWNHERKYLEKRYQSIPFPFEEIKTPTFQSRYNWKLNDLIGYLGTWSAVRNYIIKNDSNPVNEIIPDLKKLWQMESEKSVKFTILLRVGKNKDIL